MDQRGIGGFKGKTLAVMFGRDEKAQLNRLIANLDTCEDKANNTGAVVLICDLPNLP